MYFLDAVKVLFRRWYVVLVGFVLVSGAALTALILVPNQYQASGNVLFLLSPNATGADTPTNPYLNLDESLKVTTSLVAEIVGTPVVEQAMSADGFSSDYAVALAPEGPPLLLITATDTDGDAAVATVEEVIRRIAAELARIQREAGAPADQTIVSQTYSVSDEAEELSGSKVRALAVIVAVGVIVTILAAFVVDRLILSRRQRLPEGAPSSGAAQPIESDRRLPTQATIPSPPERRAPREVAPTSRESVDGPPKKTPAEAVPTSVAVKREVGISAGARDAQPPARVLRTGDDRPRSRPRPYPERPGAAGSSGPQ